MNSSDSKILHPVTLDKSFTKGEGLDDLVPWPAHMLLRPLVSHRLKQWYAGEKLSSMVYEADDGMLQFTDLPYDEQCTVLRGRAILTSQDGRRDVYEVGDTFIAPKGWTGTWEFQEGYRESITFETQSLNYAMEAWFAQ